MKGSTTKNSTHQKSHLQSQNWNPATNDKQRQTTPIISQDNDIIDTSAPAANTRSQRQTHTLTQEFLYHMRDKPERTKPFTNQQVAARKYPLQFLCDFALSVLGDEIGIPSPNQKSKLLSSMEQIIQHRN